MFQLSMPRHPPSLPHRILQISTSINGGADRIALNLFHAYEERGLDSRLVVGFLPRRGSRPQADRPDPAPAAGMHDSVRSSAVQLMPHTQAGHIWSRTWWKVARRLQARGIANNWARALAQPANVLDWLRGREQMHFPGTWRLLDVQPQPPDILHCHNLHLNYFDLRALPSLSRRVPVFLTLHDAWLLSGHCAHSLGCERWTTGCGRCPDLSLYPAVRRDATAYNWQRKRAIFAASRLNVITPSRWLMHKVEQSMLMPGVGQARVIPNGVDLTVFHPADPLEARRTLAIPPHQTVLLFTANNVRQNPWKDYRTLRSAVAAVAARISAPLLFVALGESAGTEQIGQAQVRFAPFTTDPKTVAAHYQAADVYIHAARADTFPNTILEAMACGTPVVGSDVGGISEQIDDGKTGFLFAPGDVDQLVGRILDLIENPSVHRECSLAAADTAKKRFGLSRQVDEYLAFYTEAHERIHAASQRHKGA